MIFILNVCRQKPSVWPPADQMPGWMKMCWGWWSCQLFYTGLTFTQQWPVRINQAVVSWHIDAKQNMYMQVQRGFWGCLISCPWPLRSAVNALYPRRLPQPAFFSILWQTASDVSMEEKQVNVASIAMHVVYMAYMNMSRKVPCESSPFTSAVPLTSRCKHCEQREDGETNDYSQNRPSCDRTEKLKHHPCGANIGPGNVSLWANSPPGIRNIYCSRRGGKKKKTLTFSSNYHQSSLTKYISQIEQSIITSLLCSHKINE